MFVKEALISLPDPPECELKLEQHSSSIDCISKRHFKKDRLNWQSSILIRYLFCMRDSSLSDHIEPKKNLPDAWPTMNIINHLFTKLIINIMFTP